MNTVHSENAPYSVRANSFARNLMESRVILQCNFLIFLSPSREVCNWNLRFLLCHLIFVQLPFYLSLARMTTVHVIFRVKHYASERVRFLVSLLIKFAISICMINFLLLVSLPTELFVLEDDKTILNSVYTWIVVIIRFALRESVNVWDVSAMYSFGDDENMCWILCVVQKRIGHAEREIVIRA